MPLEPTRPALRARRKRPLRPPRGCRACGAELEEMRTESLKGRKVRVFCLCPCCGEKNYVAIVSF